MSSIHGSGSSSPRSASAYPESSTPANSVEDESTRFEQTYNRDGVLVAYNVQRPVGVQAAPNVPVPLSTPILRHRLNRLQHDRAMMAELKDGVFEEDGLDDTDEVGPEQAVAKDTGVVDPQRVVDQEKKDDVEPKKEPSGLGALQAQLRQGRHTTPAEQQNAQQAVRGQVKDKYRNEVALLEAAAGAVLSKDENTLTSNRGDELFCEARFVGDGDPSFSLLKVNPQYIREKNDTDLDAYIDRMAQLGKVRFKWHNNMARARLHHKGMHHRTGHPVTVLAFGMHLRGSYDMFARLLLRYPEQILEDMTNLSAGVIFDPESISRVVVDMSRQLARREVSSGHDQQGRQNATLYVEQYFLFYQSADKGDHRNVLMQFVDKMTHHNKAGKKFNKAAIANTFLRNFDLDEPLTLDEAKEMLAIMFAGAANAAIELYSRDQLSLSVMDSSLKALTGLATQIPKAGTFFKSVQDGLNDTAKIREIAPGTRARDLIQTALRQMFQTYVDLGVRDYGEILGVKVAKADLDEVEKDIHSRIASVSKYEINFTDGTSKGVGKS